MGNLRRYGEYNYLNKDAEEEKDAAEREAERDATMHDDEVYDEVPQSPTAMQYLIMQKYWCG